MRTTVVISTYNGANYIIEQLKSILLQSKHPDEVLIFDDCSQDNTVEIIKRFIQNNNLNWILYINEKNKGWKRNFIDGLKQATGDLIFTCDQDDIWHKDKIMIMSQVMENNSHINLLVSEYKEFTGKIPICDKTSNANQLVKKIELNSRFFLVEYPGCTYCIRTTFVKSAIRFWKEDYPHDALFYRFALFSDSLYKCEEVLFYWRKHQSSVFGIEKHASRNVGSKKGWLIYADDFCNTILDYIDQNGINTREKTNLLYDYKIWLKLRTEFYETKKIVKGIRLVKYFKYYRGIKQFLGDYFIVYFKDF